MLPCRCSQKIRVNRGACLFRRYKTFATLTLLTDRHSFPHSRPLDQSTHPLRVHFWPPPTTVSLLSYAAGEGKFVNSSSLFSRLIFSFSNLADRGRLSFHPLLLRPYDLSATVTPASTFSFISFTSVMGRSRTPENYQQTAEESDLVPEAHEEEG